VTGIADVRRRIMWCGVFAVAMAFVESAVVVDLRALGPAEGPLAALQSVIPRHLLVIEVYREAATIIMLLAVAALAGRGLWQRFLLFAVTFGIWDIFYYIWLRVLIGWPLSLLTWDVLFLIPIPWVAPVLAPVLVSVGLVAGSCWLLLREAHRPGAGAGLPPWAWALASAGAVLVLLSFTLDARVALVSGQPPAFRWGVFTAGVGALAIAFALAVRRASRHPEGGAGA
jgi:hypothetical protein